MRCLIVDDDDSPRALMEQLLRRAGHRVRCASDFEAARSALETGGVDVALLDLELPGTAGPAAITALRELSPHTRILVVSGHGDPRHVIAALEAGADGYLLKDELGQELADALQAVRAGHAPLSPRVASIVLRRMRRAGSEGEPPERDPATAVVVGRLSRRPPDGEG